MVDSASAPATGAPPRGGCPSAAVLRQVSARSDVMKALLWITVALAILAAVADARRRKKFDGDFEFAEEVRGSPRLLSFALSLLASTPPPSKGSASQHGRRDTYGRHTCPRLPA